MGFGAKMKKFGAAMKAANNSWGTGTGPGFDSICYIGPKNFVDNRDHTIRISSVSTGVYDFTVKDVRYVKLLASASDWVKYEIRFCDGKAFFATLYTKSVKNGNKKKPFDIYMGWMNFEWWLRDKIYQDASFTAGAAAANAPIEAEGTAEAAPSAFGEGATFTQPEEPKKPSFDESRKAAAQGRKEKSEEMTEEERAAKKKRKKRIAIWTPIAVFLAAIIVLLPLYFTATLHFAFTKDGIYTLNGSRGYILIYSYEGSKEEITIPKTLLGKPVKEIQAIDNDKVKKITIPNSVTSIELSGCTGLTEITYEGTKERWRAIEKSISWDQNTGNYTVHCTDGDIVK